MNALPDATRVPRDALWTYLRATLKTIYKKRHAYYFIGPFFILFSIFFLYPAVRSIMLSLYKREGFGAYSYVGGANYLHLVRDPVFLKAILNSVYLMVSTTAIQIVLAVAIAVALNATFVRFRKVLRSIYFSPIILSAVVVSIVFSLIFDKQYGFLNYLLSLVGIGKVGWTTTTALSKVAVAILVIWRWTGWNMVIVLAGLQGIPPELNDAAKVDGAGSWALFRYITLPLLQPVLVFITMLGVIDGLRLFAEPAVLTEGGPAQSSLTMVMYLSQQAFKYHAFGYASAIAVAIFALVAVISLISWRFINQGEA